MLPYYTFLLVSLSWLAIPMSSPRPSERNPGLGSPALPLPRGEDQCGESAGSKAGVAEDRASTSESVNRETGKKETQNEITPVSPAHRPRPPIGVAPTGVTRSRSASGENPRGWDVILESVGNCCMVAVKRERSSFQVPFRRGFCLRFPLFIHGLFPLCALLQLAFPAHFQQSPASTFNFVFVPGTCLLPCRLVSPLVLSLDVSSHGSRSAQGF